MAASKDVCVLYNPASGRGAAQKAIEQVRKDRKDEITFLTTTGPGMGVEMTRKAIRDGFRIICAAGGDGTVHEVGNGIMQEGNPDVALCVWPMGSANDYAFTLKLKQTWQTPVEQWKTTKVDVGRITAEDGRSLFVLNGMGAGFNGAVTVEARKIKWLRNWPLYAMGILQAMRRQFDKPLVRVTLDDSIRYVPTLSLTVSNAQREGGFPLSLGADLTDGLFDIIHVGPFSRWDLLRNLPNMATGNVPRNHPRAWVSRSSKVLIESDEPLRIHVDGEFLCHPEDGLKKFEVTMLPRVLPVVTGWQPL